MEFTLPENVPPELLKPAIPLLKPPVPFRDYKFWLSQIADQHRISRPNFYAYEQRNPDFIPDRLKTGNSERRIYSWAQFKILTSLYSKKIPKPGRKIKTFCNIKGGVGKSTLASQVAMYCNLLGLRVLCIDLDPQAHMTLAIGRCYVDQKKPIMSHHWFNDPPVPINQIIQMVTPLLGLIPSNLTLSSLDNLLFLQSKREDYLKDMLATIKDDWDVIIIDTSPAESILNTNAILASDELCVPCKTDFFSVDGLGHLFNVISKLMTKFRIAPTLRVIPNLYDIRDNISQESLGALRKHYGRYLGATVVRKNTDITECQKIEQAIWQYNRSSSGFSDIKELTQELLRGEHGDENTPS